jgi:alpha-galactosidase
MVRIARLLLLAAVLPGISLCLRGTRLYGVGVKEVLSRGDMKHGAGGSSSVIFPAGFSNDTVAIHSDILRAAAGSATVRSGEYASLAGTPPMGWNSWDAYGTNVREEQVRANADAMARDLAPFGYLYVVVDIQWYQPTAQGHAYIAGASLAMDDYGRLMPAVNRFPSSANGAGFKPLADYVHALGLKFGIHVMRGIPRQAVLKNTPIAGTPYHAADVADTTNGCAWNPDMWGVDVRKPGGEAYYDAVAQLYASWGVDFVKADDMGSHRFQPLEISALRRALDHTGRPIVLSISPGPAPLDAASFLEQHAQMWRISDDFWDDWLLVRRQFDFARDWASFVGDRHTWPDADMLPFGQLRLADSAGQGTPTRLTPDEMRTVMTLWSIFRSPLIIGGNLPTLDGPTIAMLTNAEVLQVNQHGEAPRQVLERPGVRVWRSTIEGNPGHYIAVFNLDSVTHHFNFTWSEVGLSVGRHPIRDLWEHNVLGKAGRLHVDLFPHACALFSIDEH